MRLIDNKLKKFFTKDAFNSMEKKLTVILEERKLTNSEFRSKEC